MDTALDAAVDAVGATDSLAVPLATGIPAEFLHALGRRDDFVDLRVFGALLNDLYPLFTRQGVHLRSGFFGPAERILCDAGADVEYVPADFRRFTSILRRLTPRVMATMAAPPDADGWMSLSLHAGATVDELHRCGADPDRVLVVEWSPRFPRTFGLGPDHRHAIHVDEVDHLIRSDRAPVVIADPETTEVDDAIASLAMRYVRDGSTLQTGIGSIPSVIAARLAESGLERLGVHSEMFTTGLMRLHQAGKVANAKGIFDGVSITTFAAGTEELYAWLDGNAEVAFAPVEVVNSPEHIAANRDMVTINGAVAVDLHGQVMVDTIGGAQFSGVGGHEDFLAGAGLQTDDRSLLCLPSTATVDGELVSRIVAGFPEGAVVSAPRHQVDVVITEHGAAELEGATVAERRRALAAIAHPAFREELERAAVTG